MCSFPVETFIKDYAWEKAERVLLDRSKDADFIARLKAMEPDIIVDLVNFDIEDTKKIVAAFQNTKLSHYLYCSSCWAHGMEIIHHVHGYDVAQVFFKAITHRNASLGESFDAEAEQSITLYGYAKHLYAFFGHEPKIKFLGWKEWCKYEGNPEECDHTYYHIVRSGTFSIEKEKRLLEYQPKFTNLETIDLAVQSYIDRGLINVKKSS